MRRQLSDRTAIVTGGSDGIGRATAVLFAREGARVFVGDFQPLAENAALFAELGISERRCDVRVEIDVRQLIDAAIQATGRLDIMVNNAGIGLVKQIPDVTEAEWDAVLDTNLKGAFLGCKHAIPHMQRGGGGSIINTASNAGLLPRAHDPVDSTSKIALVGLTKSLALCHAKDKIRVNCVCPGPVGETGMMNASLREAADPEALAAQLVAASPLAKAFGRMISPEEVAEAMLYFASDASLMVTGTALAIDGGKSLGVP